MGMLGVTFTARARGRNAAGESIPSKQETWSTDTPEVLEVTPEGDVTSLNEGEGRVIARLDGVEAVIRVPVREVARLEWQASLGAIGGSGAPAVGPGGTVYASGISGVLGGENRFWAFDPGGAVRWSLFTSGAYPGATIRSDGTLYVGVPRFTGDDGGAVLALDPGGQELWKLERPGSIDLPVLGEDGVLFALEKEGPGNNAILTLLAVEAETGEVLWEYRIEGQQVPFPGALAVTPDNTVYFRTRNSVIHAVGGEGEPLWTVQLGAGDEEELMYGSLAIGADGTIYGGTKAGRLYALNPDDGSVRWALELGPQINSGVAIGADGTIYQAVPVEGLFAISPGGEVLWTWSMEGVFASVASPVIGGDGTVYLGGRSVVAVHPDGTLKWDFSFDRSVRSASAIGMDGMIYVVSPDGMLHAIRELEEGNGGFDASPWPVWRGNRQNTGRAGP